MSNFEAMAKLIDGRVVAAAVRAEVKAGVDALKAEHNLQPGLATLIVGENPASQTYVRMKHRACEEVGIRSFGHALPATASQTEVEDLVSGLSQRPDVHGILVQLPLPSHLNEEPILAAVRLEKDVDGFHPLNMGRLAQKGPEPLFLPATPAGVMRLLAWVGVPLAGARAVVIGRSNIVGMPVALLLNRSDCTVTIGHSRSKDLPGLAREADILIAAAGRPFMVKADWVKPGAIVIDVGTNRLEDGRLVGDVAFDEVQAVAGAITPVPGGVGPMTIAMLLSNTLKAARLQGQAGS
jgi:methylenetetrahydrofolate dehydrogenase (NADP+) / methenyltetrahydrofolate cyclohydrolase